MAGTALCEPACADFVAGTTLCEPPPGAALCEPPCADFVAGTALWEPPCADFVAGTASGELEAENWRAALVVQLQYAEQFVSWKLRTGDIVVQL